MWRGPVRELQTHQTEEPPYELMRRAVCVSLGVKEGRSQRKQGTV